jgi:hypothetical protein
MRRVGRNGWRGAIKKEREKANLMFKSAEGSSAEGIGTLVGTRDGPLLLRQWWCIHGSSHLREEEGGEIVVDGGGYFAREGNKVIS